MINFTVWCSPAGQPRAKASTFGGHTRMYTPSTIGKGLDKRPHPVVEFKHAAREAFRAAYRGQPLEGPVRVDAVFVFPRVKKYIWKSRPMPRIYHTSKPDRDNADKALLDCLSGLAFVDDCQVCAGSLEKWIAAGDEVPHVEISITPLSS